MMPSSRSDSHRRRRRAATTGLDVWDHLFPEEPRRATRTPMHSHVEHYVSEDSSEDDGARWWSQVEVAIEADLSDGTDLADDSLLLKRLRIRTKRPPAAGDEPRRDPKRRRPG